MENDDIGPIPMASINIPILEKLPSGEWQWWHKGGCGIEPNKYYAIKAAKRYGEYVEIEENHGHCR